MHPSKLHPIIPLAVAVCSCGLAGRGLAIDFSGTQPAAIDQPRVNALLQPASGGQPYTFTADGFSTFNMFGFLDTGTSGVVISRSTADLLGVPRQTGVTFSDVAVGGNTEFDVSQTLNIRVAPTTATDVDNPNTFMSVYNQALNGVQVPIGPTNVTPDPLSAPLDVFGMPLMMGKTVVIDPKPANDLSDYIHTSIHNQGDGAIPTTSHHVALSYGDFERFTTTTGPEGFLPPALAHNPFIGPDPVAQLDGGPPPGSPPPVSLGYEGLQVQGSFLLDTGAATSFISTGLAAQLDVRYRQGTFGTDDPILEDFDGNEIPNQYELPIQSVAGIVTVAGFFLDELLLPTIEGGANEADPNHIRYLGAPVALIDITVVDPQTQQHLTLDGAFGMNYLVGSVSSDFEDWIISPYNMITFDEPNALLGLDPIVVPEPTSLALALLGAIGVFLSTKRRKPRAAWR